MKGLKVLMPKNDSKWHSNAESSESAQLSHRTWFKPDMAIRLQFHGKSDGFWRLHQIYSDEKCKKAPLEYLFTYHSDIFNIRNNLKIGLRVTYKHVQNWDTSYCVNWNFTSSPQINSSNSIVTGFFPLECRKYFLKFD